MNIHRGLEAGTPEYRRILRRGSVSDERTVDGVRSICARVWEQGDTALMEFAEQFDHVRPDRLHVIPEDIAAAGAWIPREHRVAIETAAANIRTFHAAQRGEDRPVETSPGVHCWRERRPIERVGLYVPAGSAPLPSTVLMLGVPAIIAGCSRIIVCSPPNREGKVDPYVLAAASILGLDEVYAVGGAQAIAAMARGTESVPRVDKIFGPGNRWVAAAKRLVSSMADGPAVDLVAGPSELLVIADHTADPRHVAADLLSQAEHDPDAQVVLATPSEDLARKVVEEISRQVESLSRREIVQRALDGSYILVTVSLEGAIAFSNDYAPEHLIVNVEHPRDVAPRITSAGSVFLGPWAPVTAGDYASGTNHTLPTGGSAHTTGGLSLESFQKSISFQEITRDGLAALSPTLAALAELEGLDAHGRAVEIRMRDQR